MNFIKIMCEQLNISEKELRNLIFANGVNGELSIIGYFIVLSLSISLGNAFIEFFSQVKSDKIVM